MEYFANIGKIRYEGKNSTNPLAFKYYNPDEIIGGKTMKEQLRQLFIYRKLTKGNLDGISLPEIPEGRITNQKRTILFEQFRQQFLQ